MHLFFAWISHESDPGVYDAHQPLKQNIGSMAFISIHYSGNHYASKQECSCLQ